MTASRPLSNDESVREQYSTILLELRKTIQAMADENKKLLNLAVYYAVTDWRELSLLDRGEKARKMLKEVNGR